MATDVVEIDQTNAIEHIEFRMPPDRGGVKVLTGTSGSGKTTAILALRGLLGNKDALTRLEPRDGAEKGKIVGAGRTVNVGKRVSAVGETAVPTLAAKIDLGLLVDPRVAEPAARTKTRIRTLVSAGGVAVTPRDLLGEQYADALQRIDVDAVKGVDDPVAMADKLKRAIDAQALEFEKESDVQAGLASAKAIEAGDIDELTTAQDSEELANAYRVATQAVIRLTQAEETHKNWEKSQAEVQLQIEQFNATSPAANLEELQTKRTAQQSVIDGLEKRLAIARDSIKQITAAIEAEETRKQQLAILERRLQPNEPTKVTEQEIADAKAAEEKAHAAMRAADDISRRKTALAESKKYSDKSNELAKLAGRFRAAAQQVMVEVQKALPPGPIQIADGELVVQHAKRKKKVAFDTLSDGERWSIAMEYAINSVGPGGWIPLAQESWQALAPELKAQVVRQCEKAKVWLITGEVAEGDLRVVDYEG